MQTVACPTGGLLHEAGEGVFKGDHPHPLAEGDLGDEVLELLVESFEAQGRPLPPPRLYEIPAEAQKLLGVSLEGSVG